MENITLSFCLKKSTLKPLFASVLILLFCDVRGQEPPYSPYLDHPWVDSVLASLSAEERIAQWIWISTGADEPVSHLAETDHIIRQHGIGGVVFQPGDPNRQSGLVQHYQSISKIPLAVAADGEWGPFPSQLSLEAIPDTSLKIQAGRRMARQLRGRGINLVLAPITDDHVRTGFQENHLLVARKQIRGQDPAQWDSAFINLPGFDQLITAGMEAASSLAGCIRPEDFHSGILIDQLLALLETGSVDEDVINNRTRMILAFKYWSGLHEDSFENPPDETEFIWDLHKHSLTVLNNRDQTIPIMGLDRKKIACLAIHKGSRTAFQEMAANYTRTDDYAWPSRGMTKDSLLQTLSSYDAVLAGIHPSDASRELDTFLGSLSEQVRLISVFFGDPGAVDAMEGLKSSDGLILAYQPNLYTEELAAQLVFGGIGGQGRLPVRINGEYPEGHGIVTAGGIRLQYAYPENAGVSSAELTRKIDSIVYRGLDAGAYPGCEVMAARRGMVIFHKTYGYHTFDQRIDVRKEDLYDLASVTKVSGPLSGLMLLESMGKFSHADRLGDYAPSLKRSAKADLELKEVLAHQAGLYPYLLYWKSTVKINGNYKRRFIRDSPSEKFSVQVADRIYLKNNFRKKIYKAIRKSDLGEKKYVYSGLSFLLYPEIIEDLSGERYEDFLTDNIYHRLGAWDLVFNPYRFYPLSRIAPTEIDTLFRRQLVHGYVHDEAAAVMGGYSGNAGLFSTANDLLKLFEMYRRMGHYGGEQIIAEDVLKAYTRYQFPGQENRRGLGFDKPTLGENDGTSDDYPCPGASPSSFGHSGFTGTFAWADPENEITYVFLSNRVYPTRENDLLSRMDIRTAILQSIYDSIIK
jgi:CubicO group peptidase (beta-lactamase class C family)